MQESNRSMEIKVGGLILVSAIIIGVLVFLLGDLSCGKYAYLYVDFKDSSNLKTGALVKISGVSVGKVDRVELWGGNPDPEHNKERVFVRVRLKVSPKALGMLHEDAKFYISTLGALGKKYVEIEPGSQDRPLLDPAHIPDGVALGGFESIGQEVAPLLREISAIVKENRDDIRDMVKKTKDLVSHADELLSKKREEIETAITSMASAAKKIDLVATTVANGIGDEKALRGIMSDVATITRQLKETSQKLDSTLGDARGLIAQSKEAVTEGKTKVFSLFGQVERILERAQDPKGTIGALLNDKEIYDDLIEFIKDIKRHPWKLLRGK